jgi:hypothetical protein
VVGGIAKCYTTGTFDPSIINSVGDFLSAILGYAEGTMTEDHSYLIQKAGDGVVRIDIFSVGKNVKTTGVAD